MLSISAALGRRILPELSLGIERESGLRTWLESGSFYVEAGEAANAVVFKDVTLSEIVSYISHDYERFALSGLESFLFCAPDIGRPRALGWPLLKLYYAAFFAAHAIMRATGYGVMRLEAKHAKRITSIASAYSPDLALNAGTYSFQIIQQPDRSIDLAVRKVDDSGGAHDQLWRCFYIFLSDIGKAVAEADEFDAIAAVGEVARIQSLMTSNGLSFGTWLSYLRNQINYQHGHGVWFPYGVATKTATYVKRIKVQDSSTVRLDRDSKQEPLEAFCACCHVMSVISIELSELLCARNGAGRYSRLWRRLRSELKS